ncbi:MAG TPA: diguanylate cyclase, partial [Candidatus Omnitrophota bacterium]|nr:diguanylate cyclase [Candidatus Omnitrophota bacterium]
MSQSYHYSPQDADFGEEMFANYIENGGLMVRGVSGSGTRDVKFVLAANALMQNLVKQNKISRAFVDRIAEKAETKDTAFDPMATDAARFVANPESYAKTMLVAAKSSSVSSPIESDDYSDFEADRPYQPYTNVAARDVLQPLFAGTPDASSLSFLDVGSGSGINTVAAASEYKVNAIGIDPQASNVQFAQNLVKSYAGNLKEQGAFEKPGVVDTQIEDFVAQGVQPKSVENANFVEGSATDLPFSDNSINRIVYTDVEPFIYDQEGKDKAIDEILRVVSKQDGKIMARPKAGAKENDVAVFVDRFRNTAAQRGLALDVQRTEIAGSNNGILFTVRQSTPASSPINVAQIDSLETLLKGDLKGKRILEIGPGAKTDLIEALVDAGAEVWAVDSRIIGRGEEALIFNNPDKQSGVVAGAQAQIADMTQFLKNYMTQNPDKPFDAVISRGGFEIGYVTQEGKAQFLEKDQVKTLTDTLSLLKGGALKEDGVLVAEMHWPEMSLAAMAPGKIEEAGFRNRSVTDKVLVLQPARVSEAKSSPISLGDSEKRSAPAQMTRAQLETEVQALRSLVITDPLTKIYNRAGFEKRLAEDVSVVSRDRRHRLQVVLQDLDHFKAVNDLFGHQVGDNVLAGAARIMQESIPETATVGRWGGEEFTLSLPGMSAVQAVEVVDGIRSNLVNGVLPGEDQLNDREFVQNAITSMVKAAETGRLTKQEANNFKAALIHQFEEQGLSGVTPTTAAGEDGLKVFLVGMEGISNMPTAEQMRQMPLAELPYEQLSRWVSTSGQEGEDFAISIPGVSAAEAQKIVGDIRVKLSSESIPEFVQLNDRDFVQQKIRSFVDDAVDGKHTQKEISKVRSAIVHQFKVQGIEVEGSPTPAQMMQMPLAELPYEKLDRWVVTNSAGVATFDPKEDTINTAILHADVALAQAKSERAKTQIIKNAIGERDAGIEFSHSYSQGEAIVEQMTREDLEKEVAVLRDLESFDQLTRVYNRRAFDKKVEEAVASVRAPGERRKRLNFVMVDIDYFKSINDLFGHDVGDDVLRGLGVVAKASVRDSDKVGRWGGEEFGIVIPNASAMDTVRIVDRIRAGLRNAMIPELSALNDRNFVQGKLREFVDASLSGKKTEDDVTATKVALIHQFRVQGFKDLPSNEAMMDMPLVELPYDQLDRWVVTHSAGVSDYNAAQENPTENMVLKADLALYSAKETRSNTRVYETNVQQAVNKYAKELAHSSKHFIWQLETVADTAVQGAPQSREAKSAFKIAQAHGRKVLATYGVTEGHEDFQPLMDSFIQTLAQERGRVSSSPVEQTLGSVSSPVPVEPFKAQLSFGRGRKSDNVVRILGELDKTDLKEQPQQYLGLLVSYSREVNDKPERAIEARAEITRAKTYIKENYIASADDLVKYSDALDISPKGQALVAAYTRLRDDEIHITLPRMADVAKISNTEAQEIFDAEIRPVIKIAEQKLPADQEIMAIMDSAEADDLEEKAFASLESDIRDAVNKGEFATYDDVVAVTQGMTQSTKHRVLGKLQSWQLSGRDFKNIQEAATQAEAVAPRPVQVMGHVVRVHNQVKSSKLQNLQSNDDLVPRIQEFYAGIEGFHLKGNLKGLERAHIGNQRAIFRQLNNGGVVLLGVENRGDIDYGAYEKFTPANMSDEELLAKSYELTEKVSSPIESQDRIAVVVSRDSKDIDYEDLRTLTGAVNNASPDQRSVVLAKISDVMKSNPKIESEIRSQGEVVLDVQPPAGYSELVTLTPEQVQNLSPKMANLSPYRTERAILAVVAQDPVVLKGDGTAYDGNNRIIWAQKMNAPLKAYVPKGQKEMLLASLSQSSRDKGTASSSPVAWQLTQSPARQMPLTSQERAHSLETKEIVKRGGMMQVSSSVVARPSPMAM